LRVTSRGLGDVYKRQLFNDASIICRMLNKLIESRIKRGSSLG
jgi:hypothetical protein